jgi:hypothetical protein
LLWGENEAAMTSFQALALLVASVFVIIYLLSIWTKHVRWALMIVQTGLADGVPVSMEFRWRLLWIWYFPSAVCVVGLCVIGALLHIQIGMHVDDTKIRNLAYLVASGLGVAAILWTFGIAGWMRHLLALFRKEKS